MSVEPSTPEGRTIRVQVAMNTDNLRKWAEWHADHGHHDVAHALFRSAQRYDDQASALERLGEIRCESCNNSLRYGPGCCVSDENRPHRYRVEDLHAAMDGVW